MATYQSSSGLYIRQGADQAGQATKYGAYHKGDGAIKELIYELDYANLPDYTADLDNDGTLDGFTERDVYIPANASIVEAFIKVDTAFASGGSTTLTVGLYELDGTVIDADGIDATIAKTAIDAAGDLVACDGARVGAAATPVGADNAYIKTTVASGPYTAGQGKLIIRYIV